MTTSSAYEITTDGKVYRDGHRVLSTDPDYLEVVDVALAEQAANAAWLWEIEWIARQYGEL